MVQTYLCFKIPVWFDLPCHSHMARAERRATWGGLTAQSYEDPQDSRWPKERAAVRSARNNRRDREALKLEPTKNWVQPRDPFLKRSNDAALYLRIAA